MTRRESPSLHLHVNNMPFSSANLHVTVKANPYSFAEQSQENFCYVWSATDENSESHSGIALNIHSWRTLIRTDPL